MLTMARILIIPAIIGTFYMGEENSVLASVLASALFALAGITDYFDGYLARAYGVQSKLGRFLDPIADKLLVASVILMLVHLKRADILPAIAIVCREILVSGLREYLAEVNVSVPVSGLAKFKTAGQMAAIFLILLAPSVAEPLVGQIGQLLLWAAAVLTLITGYAYLRQGLKHMDL